MLFIVSSVSLFIHPTELQIVPNMTHVSVALPGVVVSVIGAAESGSVMAATVTHISSVLPPLWPRCVGVHTVHAAAMVTLCTHVNSTYILCMR